MIRQIDLHIDVTDALGLGEPAHVAATVVLPDPDTPAQPAIVAFAKPGGTYRRTYFTTDLPGPARGAQGHFHAARGWVFVAMDTLGCGDSSQHDPRLLDFATVTAAAAAAEQDILLRLANGVLLPGYPPINQPVVLGMGQSVGGALAIYQQARHRGYDGVCILGFSAIHSHPPTPPGEPPVIVAWYPRDSDPAQGATPVNQPAISSALAEAQQDASWTALAWGFHYDDVPHDAVELDLLHYEAMGDGPEASARLPLPPWKTPRTLQRVARSALTPGVVAAEAAAIAVPVLCAMGERDMVADPAGEPRAFRSAPSVDLFTCPRMAHMHNFAGTRELLWHRIDAFGAWCRAWKAGTATARSADGDL